MHRLRVTPLRAALLVAVVVAVSFPAQINGWTGWPWAPLRFALVVAALWALATVRPRIVVVALVVLVTLCPPVAVHVDRGSEWSAEQTGELVNTAIGATEVVRWHGAPIGQVHLSTRDKSYLNGEGGYADRDLVATTVTWLPWPSIRREHVIGLGGNVVDFWLDEPQLRRDGDGLFVTSTRYYPGVLPAGTSAKEHQWWERRRIALGNALDPLTIAAWGLAVVLLAARLARFRS